MAKRKKVDGEKLIKMVESGAHQKEIMKKFGFKTANAAKLAYANAQIQAGKIAPFVGGRGASTTASVDTTKIGKSGKISLSKEMVVGFGFKEGDEFTVKTRGGNIITLKKVEPEAVAEEKA